jgi:hypothetical protein
LSAQKIVCKKPSRIPAIAAMQAEVPPGHCAFCEEPIVAFERFPAFRCGGVECERGYHRLYREHRTRTLHQRGLTANGKRLVGVSP